MSEYCEHCEENYHMWDIVVNEHRYVPKLGDKVLDLGAWYGHFTFYCASRGAKVVAFEPIPSSYGRLIQKLGKEPWRANVDVHQVAVESQVLYIPANGRAASGFQKEGTQVAVATEALSAILKRSEKWDCVKVDIEGAEIFFEGADLSNARFLTMELHSDTMTLDQNYSLVQYLARQFDQHENVWEEKNGISTGYVSKFFGTNQ